MICEHGRSPGEVHLEYNTVSSHSFASPATPIPDRRWRSRGSPPRRVAPRSMLGRHPDLSRQLWPARRSRNGNEPGRHEDRDRAPLADARHGRGDGHVVCDGDRRGGGHGRRGTGHLDEHRHDDRDGRYGRRGHLRRVRQDEGHGDPRFRDRPGHGGGRAAAHRPRGPRDPLRRHGRRRLDRQHELAERRGSVGMVWHTYGWEREGDLSEPLQKRIDRCDSRGDRRTEPPGRILPEPQQPLPAISPPNWAS